MTEIYIEKVKINKIGAIVYFIGFLFMIVSGIAIMIKTGSTDRMQVLAWVLLGVAGYYLYSRFDELVYSKIRKPNKIKKVNKKEVNKLVGYFMFLFLIAHTINIGTFFYLMGTPLSNLAIFLLYFPIALGWETIIIVYGILLLLWRNDFELKKIIEKLKQRGDKE